MIAAKRLTQASQLLMSSSFSSQCVALRGKVQRLDGDGRDEELYAARHFGRNGRTPTASDWPARLDKPAKVLYLQ